MTNVKRSIKRSKSEKSDPRKGKKNKREDVRWFGARDDEHIYVLPEPAVSFNPPNKRGPGTRIIRAKNVDEAWERFREKFVREFGDEPEAYDKREIKKVI